MRKNMPGIIVGAIVAVVVVVIGIFVVRGMTADSNALKDTRDDITIGMNFKADPAPKEFMNTLDNPRHAEEKRRLRTDKLIEFNVIVRGCSVELERLRYETQGKQVNGRKIENYRVDEVLYNKGEIDLEDYGHPLGVHSIADVEAFLQYVMSKGTKLPCFK